MSSTVIQMMQAEAGSSGIVTGRRSTTGQVGAEHFTMKVPNNKAGKSNHACVCYALAIFMILLEFMMAFVFLVSRLA